MDLLLLAILAPLAVGVAVLVIPGRMRFLRDGLLLSGSILNLWLTVLLIGKDYSLSMPWVGSMFNFTLRIYNFSSFIVCAAACFGVLVAIYSIAFFRNRSFAKSFYFLLLITLSLVNGLVLSDSLLAVLFFWEGMLITMFCMIAIGKKDAFRTATKAFIIVGIADICMMVGIALAGHMAGSMDISRIHLTVSGMGSVAFIFLLIGALAKSGALPFHTWIPDAAVDAPLPFMALVPGCIEKLIGIYFLTRIVMDMFKIEPSSWASYTLMTIGALTIIIAVMLALVQKDYKRLLGYHAISQVGYMILGVGTAIPIGIIGGLFHMLNNAMYKNCLFMTAGSAEKQTGTTNLEKLGGLWSKMPVTFACFVVAALSISGVPPFNGFFSKELVYEGAMSRGMIFYLAAIGGSFLTAASFLKLGHAAFLGHINNENRNVREAPMAMLLPMIIIAIMCVVFGIFNFIPLDIIFKPIIGIDAFRGHRISGFPQNPLFTIITIAILIAALLNHIYGVRKTGRGLGAADHIHYAPGLKYMYDTQAKGYLDPYNIGMVMVEFLSKLSMRIDRGINWIYDSFSVDTAFALSRIIRKTNDGNNRTYLVWSISAVVIILILMLK